MIQWKTILLTVALVAALLALTTLKIYFVRSDSGGSLIWNANRAYLIISEKKVGICDSCAAGWSVADNQITPRGREQLKQAKAKSMKTIYTKKQPLEKVQQESQAAERMELAREIAKHDPPPIILPAASQAVDRKLLAKTAARLQKRKSVLATIKCSPVKN